MYKRSVEKYARNNTARPFDERLPIILRPSLFRLAAETNWTTFIYKRSQVCVSVCIFFFLSVGEVCPIQTSDLPLNDENYKLATNDRVTVELLRTKKSAEFTLARRI